MRREKPRPYESATRRGASTDWTLYRDPARTTVVLAHHGGWDPQTTFEAERRAIAGAGSR